MDILLFCFPITIIRVLEQKGKAIFNIE